jgi:hypothetical protein
LGDPNDEDPSVEMSTFSAPELFANDIYFAEPLTCRSGESLVISESEGVAKVLNRDGVETARTNLVDEPVQQGSEFTITKSFDTENLGPFGRSHEVDLGEPEVCNLGSFDLDNFMDEGIEEAAGELSRVMGLPIENSRDALYQAVNAFTLFAETNPLEDLMAGTVTTTIEEVARPGEIVGKTEKPVEELRAEARENIERHSRQLSDENQQLDALIDHPSHMRFIKQKQDEAFLAGRAAALEELRAELFPETAKCDDPDCGCTQDGRYGLGS